MEPATKEQNGSDYRSELEAEVELGRILQDRYGFKRDTVLNRYEDVVGSMGLSGNASADLLTMRDAQGEVAERATRVKKQLEAGPLKKAARTLDVAVYEGALSLAASTIDIANLLPQKKDFAGHEEVSEIAQKIRNVRDRDVNYYRRTRLDPEFTGSLPGKVVGAAPSLVFAWAQPATIWPLMLEEGRSFSEEAIGKSIAEMTDEERNRAEVMRLAYMGIGGSFEKLGLGKITKNFLKGGTAKAVQDTLEAAIVEGTTESAQQRLLRGLSKYIQDSGVEVFDSDTLLGMATEFFTSDEFAVGAILGGGARGIGESGAAVYNKFLDPETGATRADFNAVKDLSSQEVGASVLAATGGDVEAAELAVAAHKGDEEARQAYVDRNYYSEEELGDYGEILDTTEQEVLRRESESEESGQIAEREQAAQTDADTKLRLDAANAAQELIGLSMQEDLTVDQDDSRVVDAITRLNEIADAQGLEGADRDAYITTQLTAAAANNGITLEELQQNIDQFRIFGEATREFVGDVVHYRMNLNAGADVRTVYEEAGHVEFKRLVDSVGRDEAYSQALQWKQQIEAESGEKTHGDTFEDVDEWLASKEVVAWGLRNYNNPDAMQSIPDAIRQWIQKVIATLKATFADAELLTRLDSEGKLDPEFRAFLQRAVGVQDQAATAEDIAAAFENFMSGRRREFAEDEEALMQAEDVQDKRELMDLFTKGNIKNRMKIPTKAADSSMSGELDKVRESFGKRWPFLSSKNAPSLDELALSLNERGFRTIKTPDDVIEALLAASRGEQLFSQAERTAQQDILDEDVSFQMREGLDNIEVEGENLAVIHNLSEANLNFAQSEFGGTLPAPSIAVIDTQKSKFEGFGEITLIAKPQLIDPSQSRSHHVFNADAYTPRFPSFKFMPTRNQKDRVINDVSEEMEYLDKKSWDFFESGFEDDGIDRFENNPVFMLKYLREQGKDQRKLYTKLPPIPKSYKKFAKKGVNLYELAADEEFQQAVKEKLQSDLEGKKPEVRRILENRYFNEDGTVPNRLVEQEARDVATYAKGKQLAVGDMERAMRKKLKPREFRNWLNERYGYVAENKKIFDGFTPSGNRKYLPFNLDTVVRLMSKNIQAGENFNYGVGSIRAATTRKFKNLKDIQKSRGKISTTEEMETFKAAAEEEFMALAEEIRPYYGGNPNDFGYLNNVSEWMQDIAKGKAHEWNIFDVPAETMKDVAKFLDKLRNAPTEYFEAKITDGVDLNEFETAVVSKHVSKKSKDLLKSKGLKVRLYDSTQEGERQRVIEQASRQADATFSVRRQDDVATAFQTRRADPEQERQQQLDTIARKLATVEQQRLAAIKKLHDEGEDVTAKLQELDEVRKTLPTSIRHRLGGDVQISKRKTRMGRQNELNRRITRARDLEQRHEAQQRKNWLRKTFNRFGTGKGRKLQKQAEELTNEVRDIMRVAAFAANSDTAERAIEKMEKPTGMSQEKFEEVANDFAGLLQATNKDGKRIEAAFFAVQDLLRSGKYQMETFKTQRAAEFDAQVDEVTDYVLRGDRPMSDAEIKQAQEERALSEKVTDWIDNGMTGITAGFENIVRRMDGEQGGPLWDWLYADDVDGVDASVNRSNIYKLDAGEYIAEALGEAFPELKTPKGDPDQKAIIREIDKLEQRPKKGETTGVEFSNKEGQDVKDQPVSRSEAMSIWLVLRQPGSHPTFTVQHGVQDIEAFRQSLEEYIGDDGMAIIEKVVTPFYDDAYYDLNEVHERVEGFSVDQVKDYFKFIREAGYTGKDIEDASNPFENFTTADNKASIDKGSLVTRTEGAESPFRFISVFESLTQSVAFNANYIGKAGLEKRFRRLSGDPEFRRAIRQTLGAGGEKQFFGAVDSVIRGHIKTEKWGSRLFEGLRTVGVTSVLGLKPKVMFTQLTSIPAGMADMDAKAWAEGAWKIARDPAYHWNILKDTPAMRDRMSRSQSQEVLQELRKIGKLNLRDDVLSRLEVATTYSMAMIKMGDIMGASLSAGPVYFDTYKKVLAETGSEAEAKRQANAAFSRSVNRSQQSPHLHAKSQAYQGNMLFRALMQFRSSPIQYLSEAHMAIREYIVARQREDWSPEKKAQVARQSVKAFIVFHILLPQAFFAIQNAMIGLWLDDDERRMDYWKGMLTTLVFGNFGSIPLWGDAAVATASKLTDTPAFQVTTAPVGAEQVAKVPSNIMKLVDPDDMDDFLTGTAQLLDLTGLGASTFKKSVDSVFELVDEGDPKEVLELLGWSEWLFGE